MGKKTAAEYDIKSQEIAENTWKQGHIHLTVDGHGLVSLWDKPVVDKEGNPIDSYLKLPLTKEQQELIEATRKKNGFTP